MPVKTKKIAKKLTTPDNKPIKSQKELENKEVEKKNLRTAKKYKEVSNKAIEVTNLFS
jgi:hypothetical protein